MSDCMIQLINLKKVFKEQKTVNEQAAVNDVSIKIKKGEFITLLGPSGCGKTTTLRMIAGFEEPSSGSILIDGQDVSYKQPHERDVNTVFQSYALFPHMNVYSNVAFGLKIKKVPNEEIKKKVSEVLKLVQLEGYDLRYPNQLSGGQKQRVAIARAVVNSPKVLLLDEPLGALDLKLRKQMQFELKHLQQKLGITFIYVTHDQEEALTMSDRIAVMNNGKIEQVGTPDEIYEKPHTKFVADFIGESNMFEAKVKNYQGDLINLVIEDGQDISIKADAEKKDLCSGENILITIRPERMKFSKTPEKGKNSVCCTIKERVYIGSIQKTIAQLKNGKEITVSEPAGYVFDYNNNKDAFVSWEYEHGVVIKG
ncbi:spermidine/putrescine import ATP-binding protein PotA [Oxobacter pfennigii]|uniref:Spermidine/putrescine import ATP-binding protein PotA n=1 Tax=Oxobacter pfennigii TaxID=36849 RepID=A0A0P8WJL5_9CLOT|nr:ABC transporter ATP-binding protein [Oxobacter pfennigii]KPU42348.1 spermidine/putrescine import ATP-binding protein PotA [Oxobacter pfennigii]